MKKKRLVEGVEKPTSWGPFSTILLGSGSKVKKWGRQNEKLWWDGHEKKQATKLIRGVEDKNNPVEKKRKKKKERKKRVQKRLQKLKARQGGSGKIIRPLPGAPKKKPGDRVGKKGRRKKKKTAGETERREKKGDKLSKSKDRPAWTLTLSGRK